MRVVGVGAVRDRLTGVDLAGDEERFQVGDGAAAGQVPQVLGEAEHRGQLRHDLLLHAGSGRPAVQGVVVGVDQHGADVTDYRRRVRWLEHLPDIAGMEERVVLPQPSCSAPVARSSSSRGTSSEGCGAKSPYPAIQPVVASMA